MTSAQDTTARRRPTVFISYSHDSEAYKQRVSEFVWALQDPGGCEVELDQFHQTEIVDWPRWCREQISRERSDFVICICTAEYKRCIEDRERPGKGKGVFWEGALLDDEIYDSRGNERIISVLFGDELETSLPAMLRGWTRCHMQAFTQDDTGFEHLLRIFHRAPDTIPQTVSDPPDLSPRHVPPAADENNSKPPAERPDKPRIAPSKLPRTGDVLIGREDELAIPDVAWTNPQTCIVQIVAPGGVGKTQLVKKWRESLLDRSTGCQPVENPDVSSEATATVL